MFLFKFRFFASSSSQPWELTERRSSEVRERKSTTIAGPPEIKLSSAPLYEIGDLCRKYCPPLGGWDRCDRRRTPLQWEVCSLDMNII
ncbi:hypothetical protein Y032_1011g3390 [Ancylostoma ceylanicum]|uniref:Uncharacterized protein n=1 Tax=Ancylostoma ceylanicum TaxID=53326 RepID=A0A016W8L9_9BILA|nr:hypothetical protein Y032_1011g3390 [Ancylostoma ceylanicum]